MPLNTSRLSASLRSSTRVLILALVFALSVTASQSALALSIGTQHPYYGTEFFQKVAQGDRDQALISDLRAVMVSKHITNPGQFDIISKDCPSGQKCTEHASVGYAIARQKLMGEMYLVELGGNVFGVQDVYCEKVFSKSDFKKGPLPAPNTIPEDAVINAEHTWPQSKFSSKYPTAVQKSDLHHLFPTDSEMNRIRGNFHFGVVDHPKTALRCPTVKVGNANGSSETIFEPPNQHKGNVARALFYFSVRYSIEIKNSEEAILKKWSQDDPVDLQERLRNDRIQQIQGNRNPFVDFPELADAINDF